MLLNAKPKEEEVVDLSELKADSPWWLSPPLHFLFFLLPFFLITIAVSGPYMIKLGQKINNITPENIAIGILSIAMLTLGASLFSFIKSGQKEPVAYDASSVEKILSFLGVLSIAANTIYFFPLLFHPGVILSFFSGNVSAMYEMRATLEQIPGITSFMTASMPFFSLYSFVTISKTGYKVSKLNRKMFYIMLFFAAARAIVGSQRLALVIAIMAYLAPRIVFVWKRGVVRFLTPFAGILGVFVLFAFGEYFRSWQFYKLRYENFWEFISVRFLGYFSTAINTGSGVISNYEPYGYPYYTANWLVKLLRIFNIEFSERGSIVQDYLNRYTTPEFNNPGGLYIPYMDYGIIGGAAFFLLAGLFTGWLFYKFIRKDPIGILLFPSWFVGGLNLIRGILWTWSGYTPIIVLSIICAFLLKRTKIPETSKQKKPDEDHPPDKYPNILSAGAHR